MIKLLRILMSLLGAAAAPALMAGIFSYRLLDGVTSIPNLNLAQSTLSIVFANALVWAIIAGIPLFLQLSRRGRLNWRWVAAWSTLIGFVVVHFYFVALYGPTVLGFWFAAPLFVLLYIAPYVALAPLGALTALLVWKTFPLPDHAETGHA